MPVSKVRQMPVSEVRQLVSPQNPFALGKNPGRLAPAHILNGFVAAAFGVSGRGAEVRPLLAANRIESAAPTGIPFIDQGPWRSDATQLAALREDFALIFNPDHRMWGKFGSLTVVHSLLALNTPDDD